MLKVKIQLTYRLIPYEIEIEASDQTDLTYVLGEGLLAKVLDSIHAFIDEYFRRNEEKTKP